MSLGGCPSPSLPPVLILGSLGEDRMRPLGLGDCRVWTSLWGFLDTKTLFPLAQRESVEGCAPNTCVNRILTDHRGRVPALRLCRVETAHLPETQACHRPKGDSTTRSQGSHADQRGAGGRRAPRLPRERPLLKCRSFLPALDIAQLGPTAPPHLGGLEQVGHRPPPGNVPPRPKAETQCWALNILARGFTSSTTP